MTVGLLTGRMGRAALTLPGSRSWIETLLTAAVYSAIALPVAFAAGLVAPQDRLSGGAALLAALRSVVLPGLLEETLFRVLPNPHPTEGADPARVLRAGVLSLAAYVLAHPLVSLVVPGGEILLAPAFLGLTALLGACCLLLYRRSGSLWPPLALHSFVVASWLTMGGRGVLPVME